MDPFPFTSEDWKSISELVGDHTRASLADDDVLSASYFLRLLELLDELRAVYGQHPVLLEVEADVCSDPKCSRELYEKAIELAVEFGLPTYTIRISFADLLMESFAAPREAERQLVACTNEVASLGDEYERDQWRALVGQCKRAE